MATPSSPPEGSSLSNSRACTGMARVRGHQWQAMTERRQPCWRQRRLLRQARAHASRKKRAREACKADAAEEPGAKRARLAKAPVDAVAIDGPIELGAGEAGNAVLLGDLAPKIAAWTYPLKDEEWRCFAGYLPGALDKEQAARFFEVVRDGTNWQQPSGKWGPLPLKTAWMAKAPCTCRYRYGGAEVVADPYPPWMEEVLAACMPLCGLPHREQWPDACNLNLYVDGQHSVGWHSDNESLFQGKHREIRIVSLSLGQTRKFELKYGNKVLHKLDLADGDLCTMEGLTQKHFYHRVGKENGKGVGARVNITFRWILEHLPGCSLCASPTTSATTAGSAVKGVST